MLFQAKKELMYLKICLLFADRQNDLINLLVLTNLFSSLVMDDRQLTKFAFIFVLHSFNDPGVTGRVSPE